MAAGDERAYRALVDEYAGLLWAVARAHRLDATDAADVVQTTWLRFVEHLDQLRDPARVGAWLATTARRESLKVLRHRATTAPQELPELPDARSQPDALVIERERSAILRSALSRLRASDSALLRLLMADPPPSYEEISATLEMPIGSIGPTRARALERLRREAERLGLADRHLC